jgi:hypothetical protein
MSIFKDDDSRTAEAWEEARRTEETNTCAAGAHKDGQPCRRGADCRCARRLGPPIPLVADRKEALRHAR